MIHDFFCVNISTLQLDKLCACRFDLIYLVLDKADEASDRTLARHLVAMYHEHPPARAVVSENLHGSVTSSHTRHSVCAPPGGHVPRAPPALRHVCVKLQIQQSPWTFTHEV